MPQTRGLCGHLKSELDNHPTCINCTFCSRLFVCEFCSTWASSIWDRFEVRRRYARKKDKMGKTKETKEKPKKGFTSRSSSSSHKEQGSSVASGKASLSGELSCGHDDGNAFRNLSVSSSGGDPKRRGLPPSGGSHGTPGAKVKLSSSSSAQSSTPTDSHPGESDTSKYGSQVKTRPSLHASTASLTGLDRDSEVALLSPASPQADCYPSGCSVPNKSSRESRSISPGERSVQSARSGKHRTGSTEHGSTHEVPSRSSVQIEQVQPPNILCSVPNILGSVPNVLGSVNAGPNGLDSVGSVPIQAERTVSADPSRMRNSDRTETQILQVLDANSDRNETELGYLNGTEAHSNRTDSHVSNYRTKRSGDHDGHDSSDHRSTSSRHRSARDRYDRTFVLPRQALEGNRSGRSIIPLRHAEPGELSPASRLKQRRRRSPSDYSTSRSRSRSSSRTRRKSKKKSDKKKKRKRSSSSVSSRSRSASSSRERHKHRRKSKKKKSRKSRSHKRDSHAKKRKRRSPSSSSTSSSRSSPRRSPSMKRSRAQSHDGSSSSSETRSPRNQDRNTSPVDTISIHAQDGFFSQDEGQQDNQDNQSIDDPSLGMDEDKVNFASLVEEVYNLLPSDRFPRMASVVKTRPRSSIQMELMKHSTKNTSIPQSECTKGVLDCVKSSMGSKPDKEGNFPDPVSIPKDWCPDKKVFKEVTSSSRTYQAHNETIPTAMASKLDADAGRLGLSLTGTFPVKISHLEAYEKQARETIKILSHAEVFSYAAFKCLQQEEMDTRVLSKLLESISIAIKDAMSISTVQSLAIQQTRREAAISSASKPLNDMAKQKLRAAPLNSSSLFGGRIDEIYRENTDSNREDLVNNAASQLSKLAKLSSFAKPKSKPKKKKNLPKEQEAPKPQPTSYSQPFRSRGGNNSNRGSRGRGGGPSHRGASSSRKH